MSLEILAKLLVLSKFTWLIIMAAFMIGLSVLGIVLGNDIGQLNELTYKIGALVRVLQRRYRASIEEWAHAITEAEKSNDLP